MRAAGSQPNELLSTFSDRILQQSSERCAFVTAALRFWQWIRLLCQSSAGSEFIHFVNQKEKMAVDQFALSIEILAVATSTLSIKVLAVDSSTLSN